MTVDADYKVELILSFEFNKFILEYVVILLRTHTADPACYVKI